MQRSRTAHHVTNQEITVVDCLKKHFALERADVDALFKLGAIYSDQKRVLKDRLLPKGTYLRLHLQPKRFETAKIDWLSKVVSDTREYLIVNKPAGIPVHASLENREENVLAQMRQATGYPLLITQRLDNPVGGLLCFAKTSDFQKHFNSALADREVKKVYRALTTEKPPVGLQTHYMEPTDHPPKRLSLEASVGWAQCLLQIEKVEAFQDRFDSEITLLTGRTHQIRAQLSALGCPVQGDRLYGSRVKYLPKQIALFSSRLEFQMGYTDAAVFELAPPWGLDFQ